MKTAIIILSIFTLSGCASLRQVVATYEVPEKAARAIDNYCASIPYVERQINRQKINDLTAGGDIQVICVGDPE